MLEYFTIVLVLALACSALLVFMAEGVAGCTHCDFGSDRQCSEQEMGGALLGGGDRNFHLCGWRHDLHEPLSPLEHRQAFGRRN
jgi:hypothetical protein